MDPVGHAAFVGHEYVRPSFCQLTCRVTKLAKDTFLKHPFLIAASAIACFIYWPVGVSMFGALVIYSVAMAVLKVRSELSLNEIADHVAIGEDVDYPVETAQICEALNIKQIVDLPAYKGVMSGDTIPPEKMKTSIMRYGDKYIFFKLYQVHQEHVGDLIVHVFKRAGNFWKLADGTLVMQSDLADIENLVSFKNVVKGLKLA
jgi:hypothetical protein